MYKPHNHCRACGFGSPGAQGIKSNNSDQLLPVFDLGIQPLANDFTDQFSERSGYAPLKVLFCPRCTLSQLSVVVRPEILYRHYAYVTSTSDTMAGHFRALGNLISEEAKGNHLLEIGSNDGRMLEFFQDQGMSVCGIDPAENLAEIANKKGIPTIVGLFNRDTAKEAERHGMFDIVIARHVFCHVDDWKDFIHCLSIVSDRSTIVCIETPYVCDMLQRGEFDTIYHEHTSYMSLRAIRKLLEDSPFELYRVDHFPIHGGAMMLMLKLREGMQWKSASVEDFLSRERVDALVWNEFSRRAHKNIADMKQFVIEQRSNQKRIVGLGASAKSTVWVNACAFSRQHLSFITDTTIQKQWKFSPGTDIPIVDEGAILRELPDYVICFAWNFREEVLAKNSMAREKGVKFVFPIPSLEVV